jgi:RNA polymerase sigma-70 factor (ECF subfamily)
MGVVTQSAHARESTSVNEADFREFVDRHATPVLRICYRILGRLDEAEDAAQETFVLAYRARATYRGDGTTDAWIARIATRESWRRHAQLTKRATRIRPLDEATAAHPHTSMDPADEAVTAERGAAVRDAVARLPEPYREVVTLRYFADLSPASIAAVVQRPEGTVRAQLHRGLGRLKLRLEREWP